VVSGGLLFQSFRNAGEDYTISEAGTADINDGPIEQGNVDKGLGFALGLTWKWSDSPIDYTFEMSKLQNDSDAAITDATDSISSTQFHPDFSADIGEEDIGRASARVETSLMRASLLLGSDGRLDNGLDYRFRGGLTLMEFENGRTYEYFDNDTPTPNEDHLVVARNQEFTGYGFTVDGTLRKRLGESFSVFGTAGLSLLTGSSELSVKETEPDDGDTNVDDTSTVDHMVTVLKLAVGVGWQKSLRSGDLAIDLSYELESFQGLKRDIKFTDDVNDATITQVADDISVDGLKLTVGYAF
jgi:opacity protein-like surface antigen